MSFASQLFGGNVAVALGSDFAFFASLSNPAILEVPALVPGDSGGPAQDNRLLRHGCLADKKSGTAFLKSNIRRCQNGWLKFAPRVVISGGMISEPDRLTMRDALFNAGARDILTFEAGMASAVGCGWKMENEGYFPVLIIERDWIKYDVIAQYKTVASFASPGEFAAAGDEAWQRAAVLMADALGKLELGVRRQIEATPLKLVGEYAQAPGLVSRLTALFGLPVVLAPERRVAMIKGTLNVLQSLDSWLVEATKK